MEQKKPKAKMGRPTVWKPEFIDLLPPHMAKGLSFETFAGVCGVTKDTLYQWVEKYPDFSDAKKRGTELNRLFWEQVGIDGLWNTEETEQEGNYRKTTKKSLNAAVWIFNMRNRFNWTDKQEITIKDETTEESVWQRAALLAKALKPEK